MSVQDQTAATTESVSEAQDTHGVQLTDVAAGKVKCLLEQEGRDDLRLRVGVQPGGCSGLIYQLYFDERTLDGDLVRDFDGVEVVVDRMSSPYLAGRHHRLRRHHREAGLHHRQPQRRQLLRLRRQLQLTDHRSPTEAPTGSTGGGLRRHRGRAQRVGSRPCRSPSPGPSRPTT